MSGREKESDRALRFDPVNSSTVLLPQVSLHCVSVANRMSVMPWICSTQLQAIPILWFRLPS